MAAFDESKNCDNLYFKKDVHYWTEYMIDGIEASCKYSQPPDTEWTGSQTVWNQKTEKLARNSLMFADGVSVTSPAQGVQVSAANRLIGEVVQSRRRPLLGPSPG